MATNADDTQIADDDLDVSEEGLAAAKAEAEGVESSKETDEPDDDTEAENDSTEETGEEDGQTDDDTTEESTEEQSEEEPSFVKKFPNIKGDTPEEYAKNLEDAYDNSTAEFKRLRDSNQPAPDTAPPAEKEEPAESTETEKTQLPDTLSLYAKQKMDEEADTAFNEFRKDYQQVGDEDNYKTFTSTVRVLARTIYETTGRLASPKEVYQKTAAALGWEKQSVPDSKEELAMALKNKGATSKASGVSKGTPKRVKISEEEIATNLRMYPEKSREDVIKELTPYHS